MSAPYRQTLLRTLTSGEYACKPEEEPGVVYMNNKSQIKWGLHAYNGVHRMA